ncbi:hypothetical protein GGR53DRAFT_468565 [Hypoxylon sp. FL1150]|nr:hypothetical protein GGR53DRAFT_468565 [Hypoxylon sp. FL1150]
MQTETQLSDNEVDGVVPFGTLAFDIFASEYWNRTNDESQWTPLVAAYADLAWSVHYLYQIAASNIRGNIREGRTPLQFKVPQALVLYQTPVERLISSKVVCRGLVDPIWLRTYYAANLDPTYRDMANRATHLDRCGVDNGMILDDSSLYEYGEYWSRIFERIPMLLDRVTDYDYANESSISECTTPLEIIPLDAVMVICVVDKNAIEEDLVKIKWLDRLGECIWSNKIKPEDVPRMRDTLRHGGYLGGLLADHAGTEKGASGAVLSW